MEIKNQVKAYALLRVKMTITSKIETMLVLGDSLIIIQHLTNNSFPSNDTLASIVSSIKREVQFLKEVQLYHILRALIL